MKINPIIPILVISLMISSCGKSVVMQGSSMLPRVKDGEKLFLKTNLSELKRGDLITHLYPRDKTKWYLKRIIGLPNETIEIRRGIVFIDGTELNEPYLDQSYNQTKSDLAAIKIEPENYFVMGDNRDNSSDSRYWGTINKELIQGIILESSKK